MPSQIESNYRNIRERIERACSKAGRDPSSVTLIAVTKTVGQEAIMQAYDLGQRNFGENRLQEAQPKIESLPSDIRWHFIGTMQSNKTRKILGLFDAVHTFCSVSHLAEAKKSQFQVDGLVEVNIANEAKKSGLLPQDLDDFVKLVLECPQVRFQGLMTVGPLVNDPEEMRPYFRRLHEINDILGGRWLSMGMSHDFDVAIQEGATHIRVGSALFGARS